MKRTIAFLLLFICVIYSCQQDKKFSTWTQYKGSDENIHYSSLSGIDTTNVSSLKPAWEYHTGDADTANASQIQCNPIIVDGILYGTSPQMKLFAIDAATGLEKWKFNPFDTLEGDKRGFFIHNNRGEYYWVTVVKIRIYYTPDLISLYQCDNRNQCKNIW